MTTLLIFILISYGMNQILTKEYIFSWLRKLLPFKPFTCSNCMSVWVGASLSFLFPVIVITWLSPLFYGCICYTATKIITGMINEFSLDD